MKTFYIKTYSCLIETEILKEWECNGRKLILHVQDNGKYAVSDYLTGYKFREHKFKATVIRESENDMIKAIDKNYDWSQHQIINTPDFISGYKEFLRLQNGNDEFSEGFKLAIKHYIKTEIV